MKIFTFLFFITTSVYSQENCGSSDKRNMVDQLDCFCQSDGKSVVQEKIDKLGVLSKEFGKLNANDCNSAIIKTLLSVNDNKINSDVSKKLKSLNYSDEQIDKTLAPITKRIDQAKLISSGSCSKGTYSITIGPFNYKSKGSAECEAINKMDPKERQAVMMLSILMNPVIKDRNSFATQFKELEEAKKIVENYPENRILKCLKLTNSINGIGECSSSKADEGKIENCISLGMGESNSLKCLQTNADAVGFKGCKYLELGETNTMNCLQKNPEKKIALACKFLDLGETNTMNCLDMKPEGEVAEWCKFLKFGETNTMNCLNIKPNEQVTRACKLQNFGETNTINCLNLKPSKEVAESCKKLHMGETNAISCLIIKPDSEIASACENLNLGETSTLACLQSGASPEKMNQCGLKNLSEMQTLDCLKQPFNEKPTNAQVVDMPRVPKELIIEDKEGTENGLQMNNISK
jgi:hypothetical protein